MIVMVEDHGGGGGDGEREREREDAGPRLTMLTMLTRKRYGSGREIVK